MTTHAGHYGQPPHWDKMLPNRSDDSDSAFDPSRSTFTGRRAQTTSYDMQAGESDTIAGDDPRPMDDSLWVHREKLAEIERKEMQEAGLFFHGSSPSDKSQYESANETSHGDRQLGGDLVETNGFGYEEAPPSGWSHDSMGSRRGSSTSKIPVAKNSPRSPRDKPRQGSTTMDSSSPNSDKLDQGAERHPFHASDNANTADLRVGDAESHSNMGHSRAASRQLKGASPAAKTAGKSRKVSGPRVAALGSGPRDSPSSTRTRSRPTSVNRPEGEAPWIATMYKPDPMLPPDQQMLPTHAKKMMQEQWARDGQTGNAYDRQFNLINAKSPGYGHHTRNRSSPPPPNNDDTATPPLPDHQQHDSGASGLTSKHDRTTSGHSRANSNSYRMTPTLDSTPTSEMIATRRQSLSRMHPSNRSSKYVAPAAGDAQQQYPLQPLHNEQVMVHKLDLDKLRQTQQKQQQNKDKETGCGGCCTIM